MGAWVLASFDEESSMAAAARALRASGYALLEAYTPYPSPEAYEAIPGRTRIGLIVLIGALIGLATGLLLQWYCNAFSYPIIVGGRPYFSVPTYVPIGFECTVLFASFSGLYGLFITCRLPKLDHPLQDAALFERATIDSFVLAVRWESPNTGAPLEKRLRELGATEVEEVRDP